MHRDHQIELVRRVHAHLEAKTTDADPAGETLDARAYADPKRIEREGSLLFKELPLAIAHSSELPKPGDFLTHDASGTPLLVVRRDDGGLDAFINVCRHRGTRVESAPKGNKRAFSCPYHGWTYGKAGQLVTVPHERGFACIDKASRGLVRVPAGEASGLVFVRPSPIAEPQQATLDARGVLGPIADELDGLGLGSGCVYAPRGIERAMVWKLGIDIFLETYHLRTTHRESIYPMFFDNVGLVDRVGSHLRNVFPKRSIRSLVGTPEAEWSLRKHANVLYHLFPNTLVLVEPDHAAVLHVWPRGPDRTFIDAYLVVPEHPPTDKARAYWDANAKILYDATDEDMAMGESIQRGLASGANEDLVFGAFEHALTHFHREIARHTTR
jgi:phenylpropionate dioxygenase-like ring-hydroxylating dioxygenase large terminal subunit